MTRRALNTRRALSIAGLMHIRRMRIICKFPNILSNRNIIRCFLFLTTLRKYAVHIYIFISHVCEQRRDFFASHSHHHLATSRQPAGWSCVSASMRQLEAPLEIKFCSIAIAISLVSDCTAANGETTVRRLHVRKLSHILSINTYMAYVCCRMYIYGSVVWGRPSRVHTVNLYAH